MLNFTSKTKYFISSNPTDMRNGREGLAGIVREVMGHNPKCYDEAFIFYSKDYKKVKILHYDLSEGRIKAEEEKKAVVIELNQLRQEHDEKMKELQPAKEMLAEAEKNNVDCKAVIKMMLNREYNTNSDAHDPKSFCVLF